MSNPLSRTKPAGKAKSEAKKARPLDPVLNFYRTMDKTSAWNCVCLTLAVVFLFGLGTALIVVASIYDMPDIILLGVIFLIGSVLFFLMLFCSVCRPRCQRRRQVESYESLHSRKNSAQGLSRLPEPADYTYGQGGDEDLKQARNKPRPSVTQLYGRRTPVSPATATDVHVRSPDDTPPPPRLALPSDPHDPNRPTYSRSVQSPHMVNDEVSDLALL